MKYIPKVLVVDLVEAALDQPQPSKELEDALRVILETAEHPDRCAA